MIELKNISKKYGDSYALKNINLSFPKKGLFIINGPSGCGKTTLLHILSLLINFEGDLIINNKYTKRMNSTNINEFRNKKVGYIFQDFKLFEYETVEDNIKLPLDIGNNDKKELKEKRINDLLGLVSLKNKNKIKVNELSGGEKQRVAIARALVNNPSIILADEPTGNLDEYNSYEIMTILKRISKDSLVIVVSHDEVLSHKYADTLIKMKDGQIEEVVENNHNDNFVKLPLISLQKNEKQCKLPLIFLIKHTLNNFMIRKWRSALMILTMSLGLIGVGLGTVITSIISSSLISSYSSLINTEKVIISPKTNSTSYDQIMTLPYEEVDGIKNDLLQGNGDIGVFYLNDFNSFFTSFSFSFGVNDNIKTLPEYLPKHFNEIKLLKECDNIISPTPQIEVKNNEIILGTPTYLLNEICFLLQIPRTTDSFSSFLSNNALQMFVEFKNEQWGYQNEFSLNIVGVSLTEKVCLIHSSLDFPKVIFEDICKFPTTEKVGVNTSHPWDLIKGHYLKVDNNFDEILRELKFNSKYKNVVGEIINHNYCDTLYSEKDLPACDKIIFFNSKNKDRINPNYIENIIKITNCDAPLLGSLNSYSIYPNNLMMGFSRFMFVSKDTNYLNDVIDLTSYIKSSDNKIITTPNNVEMGHFAKTDGLTFNPAYSLLEGREPLRYDEIVISKFLKDKLGYKSPINKTLYITFPTSETYLSNGFIKRKYIMTSAKIVGVSSANKSELNHNSDWTILFFQRYLGISSFELPIDSIGVDVSSSRQEEVIHKLENFFPQYDISCPINSIKDSVYGVCSSIEKILIVISSTSIIIAGFLLSISNYLFFLEHKKDIGLLRCLGISKKESKKVIYFHSFFITLISFLLSSLELILICIFLNRTIGGLYGVSNSLYIDPKAFLIMLALCFGLSFLTSLFISLKIDRYDPLDCFY